MLTLSAFSLCPKTSWEAKVIDLIGLVEEISRLPNIQALACIGSQIDNGNWEKKAEKKDLKKFEQKNT